MNAPESLSTSDLHHMRPGDVHPISQTQLVILTYDLYYPITIIYCPDSNTCINILSFLTTKTRTTRPTKAILPYYNLECALAIVYAHYLQDPFDDQPSPSLTK